MLVQGDSLLNLGQPVYNNKRARKMSAFMPMRGRKDGRDGPQFEGAEGGELLLAGPYREADGDSSIMRLVSASLAAEPALRWVGGPNPRQFASQLAARHLQVGPRFGLASAPAPENSESPMIFGPSESGVLMQAKPRRAFHPMRGKKSRPGAESGDLTMLDDSENSELQLEA